MNINVDDEILQDFLIEAGEILEQLGEQLVDLEQRPDDQDLLNAVFRSFHTVKGGAGFLAIDPLVHVCHRAEDVFNVLRQGQRRVDARLMDAVLQVLDVVNVMFDQVRSGQAPDPADPSLLSELEELAQAQDAEPVAEAAAPPSSEREAVQEAQEPDAEGDITDQEFEALLDAVEEQAPQTLAKAPSGGDLITDEEFENLLDELHGKGKFQGADASAVPEPGNSSDEITDDEFEDLLDQLHGKGQFSGSVNTEPPAAAPPPPPPEKPVAKSPPPQPPKPPVPVAKQPSQAPAAAAPAVPKAVAETTVRVDTKVLDDIMNLVGELVLARNRLHTLKATMQDEEAAKAVANLDVVTSDLQLAAMKTRMQAIKKVFGRFPRVVRDLARSLNKEVDLEMQGEDTDLDKNLVEALADPLVHLVRNAVDHGVEGPDVREAAGKPRKGKVVLAARQEGDHIMLSIEDDGKGMDANVLRRKAVEKGMMDEEAASRLDDHEAFNLIFAPGFSTKTEISDVSGRGVGMDVVKTRIVQMNGTVEVESEYGQGSRIVIKVPLTLAIMPTLMVKLSSQVFALPLASVVEIFNLDLRHTNVVDGQKVILVREKALPLFYLREWLTREGMFGADKNAGHVVVVQAGRTHVGFVVDHLIGQEEVVIKPLGALLQGIAGLAGATITGDGKIALILDIPGMMKKYAR
ncbi:MAG: chemotaxis protein CheA [Chromatiales bacterium]|nr:chemotaxis protein CheA [Chromatiales bacterium]